MISMSKLREIALWVMAADFPLLYIGAVTLEDAIVTILALVIMAAAAVAAAIAF